MEKLKDITGQVYGRLTVLEFVETFNGKERWKCRCTCGTEKIISRNDMKIGRTQSCGCLQRERVAETLTTHGEAGKNTKTSEYMCWAQMKARCYNPNNKRYNTYGKRGITVCDRWLNSYENFLSDMGRRPSPDHSLDREDNDKNYEPSNCRWGTDEQQVRNTTRNHWLEYDGRKMVLMDWATELGVNHTAIIKHLNKNESFSEIYKYYTSSFFINEKKGKPSKILTTEQVIEIKQAYVKGSPGKSHELGIKYGMSKNGTNKIIRGQTWKHLNHYLPK